MSRALFVFALLCAIAGCAPRFAGNDDKFFGRVAPYVSNHPHR